MAEYLAGRLFVEIYEFVLEEVIAARPMLHGAAYANHQAIAPQKLEMAILGGLARFLINKCTARFIRFA